MRKEVLATTALAGIGIAALALASRNKPLKTVGHVDLQRYQGKWYEIARLAHIFENGWTNVTSEYHMRDDGKIAVVNSCIKNGKAVSTSGLASVDDRKNNARLDMQIQWPFSGKYWIIALAPDYSYAIVGNPNRKSLWILSRKPVMDTMTYNHLVMLAAEKGFDIRKLVKTEQEVS
jgi:apolipoprotein D and lipocalin family protein